MNLIGSVGCIAKGKGVEGSGGSGDFSFLIFVLLYITFYFCIIFSLFLTNIT